MLRADSSCFDGRIITIDITDLNEELHKIACIEKLTGDANSDAIIKDVTLRLGAQPIDLLYVDANHEFAPTTINICLYATPF